MTELVVTGPLPATRLRDLIDLGKPRLSMLVIFTSAMGLWFAPSRPGPIESVVFLLATSALVAAANTLNCWIEREIDGLMHRTRNRPLPAGRLVPRTALISGLTLGVAALGVLLATTNELTAALGAIALLTYVLVYTPLKRVTPWSLAVGAVPGAIPPLMGWTAATGTLDLAGWYLFGILFLWQLPHFLAISLYLKEDFVRGGFKVLPVVRGDLAARRHLFVYTLALVAHSLLAIRLGLAGWLYTLAAGVLGAVFVYLAATGLRPGVDTTAWARRFFGYTLLYLPALVAVLVLGTL